VRNETGAVPYGKDEAPERAAYREVKLCDVIVSIGGGRFGSECRDVPGYSITRTNSDGHSNAVFKCSFL